MTNIEDKLEALKKSKFRSSFHLNENSKKYIEDKNLFKIREHAYDFVINRLAPKEIKNDGKQTPFHGHPVFIAEHATATCCRSCLFKWHHIPKNRELTSSEVEYVVNIIMTWIEKEIGESYEKNCK